MVKNIYILLFVLFLFFGLPNYHYHQPSSIFFIWDPHLYIYLKKGSERTATSHRFQFKGDHNNIIYESIERIRFCVPRTNKNGFSQGLDNTSMHDICTKAGTLMCGKDIVQMTNKVSSRACSLIMFPMADL